MRISFISLRQPNLPPLLLLSRPVMSQHASCIPPLLDFGFLIPVLLAIFLVIRIYSPLPTLLHHYQLLFWHNDTQTMAKGIGFTHPLPYLPLTSVLYVLDSPFNLVFVGKLTRDLSCSITFSNASVTLYDWSTGKTIGLGQESQGLFPLRSAPSSTVCTSFDTPLLI